MTWGLRDIRYWSPDKLQPELHSATARVASNVLTGLAGSARRVGLEEVAAAPAPQEPQHRAYYREFVLPWIGRRHTGRSSVTDARRSGRRSRRFRMPLPDA
ncbi:hypothetical protein ACFFRL_00190 [Agromyces hippuratus]|uniref:hypothetical protein n=1 Tax=Agromyces hippuratus TaxID=286438 RepID=UPI0035F00A45